MIIIVAAVAWTILAVITLGGINLVKHIMQHDAEIAGCPDPDICPGCDGYLESDDDGSNICMECGMTWWRS